jgi:hypothetical protein
MSTPLYRRASFFQVEPTYRTRSFRQRCENARTKRHLDVLIDFAYLQTMMMTMNRLVNLVFLCFVLLVGMASAAMTDPATGIAFAPRLNDEREIVGVGVRKKGPIKV